MRKLLSILMLILFSAGSAFADTWKVTAGDKTWNPELPSSRTDTTSTHKNADGKTIKLFFAGLNQDAFLLNKNSNNNLGSLTTEAIPGKITNIKIKSGKQCSKSATVNIYVGATKITSTAKALSSQSTEYNIPVTIDNSNQTVKFEPGNANNVQISEVTITYDASGTSTPTALAKPTITTDDTNKQFTISEISGGIFIILLTSLLQLPLLIAHLLIQLPCLTKQLKALITYTLTQSRPTRLRPTLMSPLFLIQSLILQRLMSTPS